ncbi:MAG: sugar phosphate isomerase/epimerase [Phycisphaerales bacterium]|nr:sugar phosphate isomerase/epimerase [Phycisphaerales bacterium]
MFRTRTGNWPIGFRRGWGAWQKDLAGCLAWAKEQGFGVIDLGRDGDKLAAQVAEAGINIGSVDLLLWNEMMSPEAGKQEEAVARNVAYVQACAKVGVRNFFLAMLPEKPELPRAENFAALVSSLKLLTPELEKLNARLVIEGWPGPGCLCCTPEGLRALFKEVPSVAVGINYDPSHLIRMGIDPIRFLREFVDRVYHVHGKDAEVLPEAVYEFGTEQPATFAKNPPFGGPTWRYTIPGHGCMRWTCAFEILREHGYQGAVSIELEDKNFNGTQEGEQAGLLFAARFLQGC